LKHRRGKYHIGGDSMPQNDIQKNRD